MITPPADPLRTLVRTLTSAEVCRLVAQHVTNEDAFIDAFGRGSHDMHVEINGRGDHLEALVYRYDPEE